MAVQLLYHFTPVIDLTSSFVSYASLSLCGEERNAQANQRDKQERAREDQEGARGTDVGHGNEDREEGSDDAACRGDGVEQARVASRSAYLLYTQAYGERRDAAEQNHRQGEEQDDRDQRAVEDIVGECGEGEQRPVEDWRRNDRDQRHQQRGDDGNCVKQLETWITIGKQATDVVADEAAISMASEAAPATNTSRSSSQSWRARRVRVAPSRVLLGPDVAMDITGKLSFVTSDQKLLLRIQRHKASKYLRLHSERGLAQVGVLIWSYFLLQCAQKRLQHDNRRIVQILALTPGF